MEGEFYESVSVVVEKVQSAPAMRLHGVCKRGEKGVEADESRP
jgi:hypothetical protein